MAGESKSYPVIPTRHWFALRDRFKKTIPKVVTSTYLATALDMAEISASTNIMPGLRASGLIGDDGSPLPLAIKWRDDAHYKETCETIRLSAYPQELRDLAPPDSATLDEVRNWFARKGGVGESAAGKLASFYMLLCDGKPNEVPPKSESKKPPRAARNLGQQPKKSSAAAEAKGSDNGRENNGSPGKTRVPSLSLNLQILISPDSSPEQIDKIFESMAKHLKDFG